jgi:Ni/Co efflux regulator RcnB
MRAWVFAILAASSPAAGWLGAATRVTAGEETDEREREHRWVDDGVWAVDRMTNDRDQKQGSAWADLIGWRRIRNQRTGFDGDYIEPEP